jgi:hypothetical protein
MKRSIFMTVQEWYMKTSKTPWACIQTTGPDAEGRLPMTFSWNKAFLQVLNKNGYHGMSPEESVQTFFLSTQMLPEEMLKDLDTVNPSATPNLTNEANTLRR